MKNSVFRIATISELHAIVGFEKPKHPLVSVVDYSRLKVVDAPESGSFVLGFYSVNFKKNCHFVYGRKLFDHQEGTLHCSAPEQVISYNRERDAFSPEGWGLYFHPEFIRNSSLGRKIHEYSFFSYAENEALHLSEQEKQTLLLLLKQVESEYNTNIDHYSRDLILSNIELLLNYCKRFYGRQFITRVNQNKDVLVRFECFMREYFNSSQLKINGLPSVKYCAEAMKLSPNYFSDLLKNETGRSMQEHIHHHLLEKAKTLLVRPDVNISEVACELGFEYPQNFSKLFKKKVGVSPTAFRYQAFKN